MLAGCVAEPRMWSPAKSVPHSRVTQALKNKGFAEKRWDFLIECDLAAASLSERIKQPFSGGRMRRRYLREWLGDLDSNQGCPVQSREFYR